LTENGGVSQLRQAKKMLEQGVCNSLKSSVLTSFLTQTNLPQHLYCSTMFKIFIMKEGSVRVRFEAPEGKTQGKCGYYYGITEGGEKVWVRGKANVRDAPAEIKEWEVKDQESEEDEDEEYCECGDHYVSSSQMLPNFSECADCCSPKEYAEAMGVDLDKIGDRDAYEIHRDFLQENEKQDEKKIKQDDEQEVNAMESKRNQVNKAMIKRIQVNKAMINAGIKHLRRICEEAKLSNIADRLLVSSIFNPHLLLEAIKKGDDAIKFLKPSHAARLLKYCEDFLERKQTFDDAYNKAHSEGDSEKKSLLLENLPRNYRDFIDALREEQEEISPEKFSPERFFSLCKECNTKMGTKTMEEYLKKILTSEKKERSKEEAFQEYLFQQLFEKFEKAFCEGDFTLMVETLLDYVKMREKKVYENSCIVGFLRNVGMMKKRLGQSDKGYTEKVFEELDTRIPNLSAELTVLEKAGLLEWKSEDEDRTD